MTALTLVLILAGALPQTVTRGPYLQQGSETGVVVRWRTDVATPGRVVYGAAPGKPGGVASGPSGTEHEVKIAGLEPGTKYFYAVGTPTATLAGNDATHFFVTSPRRGSAKATRVWVLGDAGTSGDPRNKGPKDPRQVAVRDAYYTFTSARHTDLWLMLGDNAYPAGSDESYQRGVFNIYPEMLRKSVLWPTRGNHEKDSTAYYSMFTLPRNGEAGGLASGSEAYYAFDYGNIHFICLDSTGSSRQASSPMATWLKNDLAATAQEWVVAFWHHPPYSKGSHNSDTSRDMSEMRQNVLPVLEAGGADVVLCGHSHSYERSYLLDGHYGKSDTLAPSMKKDAGDGREGGKGAYRKSAGTPPHEGTVYVVAGSSGKTSGGSLNHPAMFVSFNTLGSMVLDFNGNRLDARFLRESGQVADHFTILKSPSRR